MNSTQIVMQWLGRYLTDGRQLVQVMEVDCVSERDEDGRLICESCSNGAAVWLWIADVRASRHWLTLDIADQP